MHTPCKLCCIMRTALVKLPSEAPGQCPNPLVMQCLHPPTLAPLPALYLPGPKPCCCAAVLLLQGMARAWGEHVAATTCLSTGLGKVQSNSCI